MGDVSSKVMEVLVLMYWPMPVLHTRHRLRAVCGQGQSFSHLSWKKVPWGPMGSLPRAFLCWTTHTPLTHPLSLHLHHFLSQHQETTNPPNALTARNPASNLLECAPRCGVTSRVPSRSRGPSAWFASPECVRPEYTERPCAHTDTHRVSERRHQKEASLVSGLRQSRPQSFPLLSPTLPHFVPFRTLLPKTTG